MNEILLCHYYREGEKKKSERERKALLSVLFHYLIDMQYETAEAVMC